VIDVKQELNSLRIDRAQAPPRPKRRLLRWLPLGLVLLVAMGSWRFWIAAKTAEPVAAVGPAAPPPLPAGPIPLLTAAGYLVPRTKAVISAKIQGRLSELVVEEGSYLPRGGLIARLESGDYRAQLLRANAGVLRATAELEEHRRLARVALALSAEQLLSRDALEAAQSRVSVAEAGLAEAQADVALAEANLEKTEIKAPFAGVVIRKMAEVGESVAPIPPGLNLSASSGAIVALADVKTLEVEADVSESSVAKLKVNQPAEVTVEAFPERRYRGTLRQLVPTADRTKATVQVKVTILDPDPQLKPEMSAKVTFLAANTTK
jgi:HlyD family secretion protein